MKNVTCKTGGPAAVVLERFVSQLRSEEEIWLKRKTLLQYEIGGKLRVLREERSLSLRELARRLGISAPYLSDIELGRRGAPKGTVEKIIHELKAGQTQWRILLR
jgi:predicted transcriptional regulator